MDEKEVGIYVHIPFCKRQCFYCHFIKFSYREIDLSRYISALIKEVGLRSQQHYKINSVYFGGGTPSILSEKELSSILDALNKHFSINPNSELTIECNPEDLNKKKLKSLNRLGFNRLSIGIQSFVKEDLQYLSRNHNHSQSERVVSDAVDSGFSNLNVDFIIGLPHQNPDSLHTNFSYVLKYNIPHVSCYLLEGKGDFKNINNKDQKLYHYTRKLLCSYGYIHYEVSNYSLLGYESLHNLKYWKNTDYIGIGVSASGYENRIDYKNVSILESYFKNISQNSLPVGETHRYDPEMRKIVTGLRLMEGISVSNFRNFEKELKLLISSDFLNKKGDNIFVNPDRILLLNEILLNFL